MENEKIIAAYAATIISSIGIICIAWENKDSIKESLDFIKDLPWTIKVSFICWLISCLLVLMYL